MPFIFFFSGCLFVIFYTAVVFNPEKIAKDLRSSGSFHSRSSSRIKYCRLLKLCSQSYYFGRCFLPRFSRHFPSIVSGVTGISSIAIGGTGILIVVSVVLEILKSHQLSAVHVQLRQIFRLGMKTILVDALGTFVIEGLSIYQPLFELLEGYPNQNYFVQCQRRTVS